MMTIKLNPLLILIVLFIGLLGCEGYVERGDEDDITSPALPEAPWLDGSWIVLNPERVGTPRTVRLVYFLPNNLEYRPQGRAVVQIDGRQGSGFLCARDGRSRLREIKFSGRNGS